MKSKRRDTDTLNQPNVKRSKQIQLESEALDYNPMTDALVDDNFQLFLHQLDEEQKDDILKQHAQAGKVIHLNLQPNNIKVTQSIANDDDFLMNVPLLTVETNNSALDTHVVVSDHDKDQTTSGINNNTNQKPLHDDTQFIKKTQFQIKYLSNQVVELFNIDDIKNMIPSREDIVLCEKLAKNYLAFDSHAHFKKYCDVAFNEQFHQSRTSYQAQVQFFKAFVQRMKNELHRDMQEHEGIRVAEMFFDILNYFSAYVQIKLFNYALSVSPAFVFLALHKIAYFERTQYHHLGLSVQNNHYFHRYFLIFLSNDHINHKNEYIKLSHNTIVNVLSNGLYVLTQIDKEDLLRSIKSIIYVYQFFLHTINSGSQRDLLSQLASLKLQWQSFLIHLCSAINENQRYEIYRAIFSEKLKYILLFSSTWQDIITTLTRLLMDIGCSLDVFLTLSKEVFTTYKQNIFKSIEDSEFNNYLKSSEKIIIDLFTVKANPESQSQSQSQAQSQSQSQAQTQTSTQSPAERNAKLTQPVSTAKKVGLVETNILFWKSATQQTIPKPVQPTIISTPDQKEWKKVVAAGSSEDSRNASPYTDSQLVLHVLDRIPYLTATYPDTLTMTDVIGITPTQDDYKIAKMLASTLKGQQSKEDFEIYYNLLCNEQFYSERQDYVSQVKFFRAFLESVDMSNESIDKLNVTLFDILHHFPAYTQIKLFAFAVYMFPQFMIKMMNSLMELESDLYKNLHVRSIEIETQVYSYRYLSVFLKTIDQSPALTQIFSSSSPFGFISTLGSLATKRLLPPDVILILQGENEILKNTIYSSLGTLSDKLSSLFKQTYVNQLIFFIRCLVALYCPDGMLLSLIRDKAFWHQKEIIAEIGKEGYKTLLTVTPDQTLMAKLKANPSLLNNILAAQSAQSVDERGHTNNMRKNI